MTYELFAFSFLGPGIVPIASALNPESSNLTHFFHVGVVPEKQPNLKIQLKFFRNVLCDL